MPSNYRWLWYLVGLAGFGLMVVGLVGILGSAWDLGILIPVVVFIAIVVVGGLLWFRRSLNAAVAAAPSRQGGAGPGAEASKPPDAASPDAGPDPPGRPATKPPANPSRTSRRAP
jgi:hypothetical protein